MGGARASIALLAVMLVGLAWGGPVSAAEEGERLTSFEHSEGLTKTWGNLYPQHLLKHTMGQGVTHGEAAARLAGVSGEPTDSNYYLGFSVEIEPTDLRDQAVAFDILSPTEGEIDALYFRWYDADGNTVGSWSSWGSPLAGQGQMTITVYPGKSGYSLSWESGRVDGEPSRVTRLEWVVGTRDPETRVEAIVDHVRLSQRPEAMLQEMEEVKGLVRETPLVADGKPAAAIVPAAEFKDAAERVQQMIADRTGATLPIVDAAEWPAERWGERTTIAIGSSANHPLIADLYMHYYTAVDAYFPGEGGYALQTVHDPYGTGKNVLVLGAEDRAGMKKATEALDTRLSDQGGEGKGLSLAPTLEIEPSELLSDKYAWIEKTRDESYPEKQVEAGREALDRGEHTGVFNRIARIGQRYMLTRDPQYALAFRDLVKLAYEHYQTDPDTYGGPWGMDSDFTAYRVITGWDVVEESPALSEGDRLQVTRILARWLSEPVQSSAAGALTSKHVRHNHTTFPSLGLYYAGRYFNNGYDAKIADRWLDIARACFEFQMECFKSHEDCNGYQWLTLGHVMRYSVASRNDLWFRNDNAAREADYALLGMDNIGYQVPYGDTGSYRAWWTEIPFLQQAAFGYLHGPNPDPERAAAYQWAVNRKRELRDRHELYQATLDGETRRPEYLTGVITPPVDPTYFENNNGPDGSVSLARALDKVSMRSSFDPAEPYLLLDGLNNGGHGHYDANTIPRITDRNRIWLADNDYFLAQPKFHNGVLVFREGRSETPPDFTRLDARADLPHLGFSASTLPGYAGVDWQRNILWGKERKFFLVLDRMRARKAGSYSFRTVWQLVGDPNYQERGVAVDQQGERFFIRSLPEFPTRHRADEDLGSNWNGYDHADPVVHFYHQIANTRLDDGEQTVIPNLLFARRDGMTGKTGLKRIAPGVFSVTGLDTPTVAGVGSEDRPVEVETPAGALRTDAAAFMITPDRVALVEATYFQLGDRQLRFDEPTSVELPAGGGRATVSTSPSQTLRGHELLSYRAEREQRDTQPIKTDRLLQALADLPMKPLALRRGGDRDDLAEPAIHHELRAAESSEDSTDRAIEAVAHGDLTGDGKADVVAGDHTGRLRAYRHDGEPLWDHQVEGPIFAVAVEDIDADGEAEVFTGGDDATLRCFTRDGELRWEQSLPRYKHRARIRVLLTANLQEGPERAIVAGADSWRYYAFDASGNELWWHESVHRSTAAAAADLAGDDRDELILGTNYYWWPTVDPEGERIWRFRAPSGPGINAVSVAQLADGPGVFFGGQAGSVHAVSPQGDSRWDFNTGDEIVGLLPADLDGDGAEELLAASMNFNVFALAGDGSQVWRADLGAPLTAMTLAGSGDQRRIVVGDRDGRVHVLGIDGKRLAQRRLEGPITVLSGTADGRCIVGTAAGELVTIRVDQ